MQRLDGEYEPQSAEFPHISLNYTPTPALRFVRQVRQTGRYSSYPPSTEFVFAKPNRMVFLKGGLWHKINPVKSNAPFAGCAIAGFFLTDKDDTPFWR